MANHGSIAFNGDHPTDLIQAAQGSCKPKCCMGVGHDDGIDFSAIMGRYFDPCPSWIVCRRSELQHPVVGAAGIGEVVHFRKANAGGTKP